MKTTTILAAAFLMVSTAFANGNETKKASQISLFEVDNQQFRLIYPFKDQEKVTVRIMDKKGNLIEKDKVQNQRGFLRKYDMSSLSEGQYVMNITSASGQFEKPFYIKDEKSLAVNHIGDKKVKLIYSGDMENGSVKIFNHEMEVIHKEKHQVMNGFSRVYDLSAFDCEKFTFSIENQMVTLAINENNN
jgi:hypothetical protein